MNLRGCEFEKQYIGAVGMLVTYYENVRAERA